MDRERANTDHCTWIKVRNGLGETIIPGSERGVPGGRW